MISESIIMESVYPSTLSGHTTRKECILAGGMNVSKSNSFSSSPIQPTRKVLILIPWRYQVNK